MAIGRNSAEVIDRIRKELPFKSSCDFEVFSSSNERFEDSLVEAKNFLERKECLNKVTKASDVLINGTTPG